MERDRMLVPVFHRLVRPHDGRTVRLSLEHPMLRGARVHAVWLGDREVGAKAAGPTEVADVGGGLWFDDGATLLLSLPPGVDRETTELSVEFDAPRAHDTPDSVADDDSRPVCIVSAQRCGSTALLWGLDRATRFKAPKLLLKPNQACEGYYLVQALQPFLTHPHSTCFGNHVDDANFTTGVLGRSGQLEPVLTDLARHLDRVYSQGSHTNGLWIDKSPGWEGIPVAPLFASLFPRGRVVFLTRDPVSCVVSMTRLLGTDLAEPTQSAIERVSMVSAIWSLIHFVWRTYCRPIIPGPRVLEVPFEQLRGKPTETLSRIGTFLQLDAEEIDRLVTETIRAPVPTNPHALAACDPTLLDLIETLCGREAALWNHVPTRGPVAHRLLEAGHGSFTGWLVSALAKCAFRADAAERAISWLSPWRDCREPPTSPRPAALFRNRHRQAGGAEAREHRFEVRTPR